MRVKARWVVTLLVGVWVVVTVLYLAPLFWAVQEEKVVRVTPVFTEETLPKRAWYYLWLGLD